MINITTIQEYELAVRQGHEPLLDWRRFKMPHTLRITLQNKFFGAGNNISQQNETFYRWVWQRKPHVCEETMKPLDWYSSIYVSHILSRGAHPEMAHDPRNINILSFEAHQKWETGDRKSMRIYEQNQIIIQILKQEYR